MSGIIAQAFMRLAARWHGAWARWYAARIETLLRAGEAYTSPKLSRLSSCCFAHRAKAVMAAKRGGFYRRRRIVCFPRNSTARDTQLDADALQQ